MEFGTHVRNHVTMDMDMKLKTCLTLEFLVFRFMRRLTNVLPCAYVKYHSSSSFGPFFPPSDPPSLPFRSSHSIFPPSPMSYSIVTLLWHKPGLTPNDFHRYYETQHVPLLLSLTLQVAFPLSHTPLKQIVVKSGLLASSFLSSRCSSNDTS